MDFNALKNVYFLGIGGIGMSALARYFKAMGAEVSGYDKTPTGLTDALEAEGIRVHFCEDITAIPSAVELVVVTPAVPRDHSEYQHFLRAGLPIMKRAEVLGRITEKMQTIAVAGTHGKTSISSMISHVLKTAQYPANAFIGGIPVNSGSNFSFVPEATTVVTEADEFDRSFLQLSPDIAVVSAIDADHLDIYGDYSSLRLAFEQFAAKVRPGGLLLSHHKLGLMAGQGITSLTYSLDEGYAHADNIKVNAGRFSFDLVVGDKIIQNITPGVPGRHNIENAIAAATVCFHLGVSSENIRLALQSFLGVRRRFEIQVDSPEIKYVDDYAHHPAEIEACIRTARELWPDLKITGVFQPHLFSRTRDFADGFAEALDALDSVVLLPIYPAREEPLPGVDSQMLLGKIRIKHKILLGINDLGRWTESFGPGVLITMGAGNIDLCVAPIRESLLKKISGGPGNE